MENTYYQEMLAAQNEAERLKKEVLELKEEIARLIKEKEDKYLDDWGDNFDRGL